MLLDQLVDCGLPGAIAGCSSAAQRAPLALEAALTTCKPCANLLGSSCALHLALHPIAETLWGEGTGLSQTSESRLD